MKLPRYMSNSLNLPVNDLIKLKDILNYFDTYVAIGDLSLWLHGFTNKKIYQHLYAKNGFALPEITLFVYGTESALHLRENPMLVAYDLDRTLPTESPEGWASLYKIALFNTENIMGVDTAPLPYLKVIQPKKFADRQLVEEILSPKCCIC